MCCHQPDSISQRGWLQAWQDLRHRKSEQHKDLQTLIQIYLSSMSNSGTVDRMLGHVKFSMLRRGTVSRGGLEASLRLIACDEGGRRQEKLEPRKLMIEPVPKTTAGGLRVAEPCTRFALHCQHLYRTWYGERMQAGRGIEPVSDEKLASARALATKPKLGTKRQRSERSEEAQLEAHAQALKRAVARVSQGGGAEAHGPLGPISLPQAASKGVKAVISQQAAACDEMRLQRLAPAASSSSGLAKQRKNSVPEGPSCSAAASSSSSAVAWRWSL